MTFLALSVVEKLKPMLRNSPPLSRQGCLDNSAQGNYCVCVSVDVQNYSCSPVVIMVGYKMFIAEEMTYNTVKVIISVAQLVKLGKVDKEPDLLHRT